MKHQFFLSILMGLCVNTFACTETFHGISSEIIEKDDFDKLYEDSTPKLTMNPSKDWGNPILDFNYIADPTAIVHDGRVYLYATNDQQQCDSVGKQNENNYGYIKTLVMASTNDMANWTYHGTIKVTEICKPWAGVSWAPSIVSRKEEDGKTHFYLFFANGGSTGLMTSTSPVGPWSDPKGRTFFDFDTPGLGDCACPFDPGAVIDNNGVCWVSFGGGDKNKTTGTDLIPGNARIAKLTSDMLHIESLEEIPAPYHFEANELNYINDTWIYTYNTSWTPRNEWPYNNTDGRPSTCCMSYMTTKTPLNKDSWVYQNNYLKNPGEYGMSYCNNHTALLKYEGKWYLFYHNLMLRDYRGIKGGFRSVCVDYLDVDENNISYKMGNMTQEGVKQIRSINPYIIQQAEMVAGTLGVKFEESDIIGDTYLSMSDSGQMTMVKGVDFTIKPKQVQVKVKGKGVLRVCVDTPSAKPIATIRVNTNEWNTVTARVNSEISGLHNIYFISACGDFSFDHWQFQ